MERRDAGTQRPPEREGPITHPGEERGNEHAGERARRAWRSKETDQGTKAPGAGGAGAAAGGVAARPTPDCELSQREREGPVARRYR